MKKTKILSLLLIAAIVVAVCVFALPTQADAATSGYYTYKVTNGEATITDCDESISGNITIPSKLGGYPVTRIEPWAFERCSRLTGVTIPNGVTSIGEYTFYYCESLTRVTIPNSVTSIGNRAFSGCSSLTSINIPNKVTSIGEYAFYYCESLTSVTIPNSVTSIGNNAFTWCSSLTSVTIPNSVTSIGDSVFIECSSLTSVTIPNSVTSIGVDAFSYCSSLTSVTIPNSVTSIGSCAFYDCSSLTSVTIPNSVTSIGNNAFSSCSSLTSVTIPNSVTSIGNCAFSGCDERITVTVPSSVKSIGDNAFESGALLRTTRNATAVRNYAAKNNNPIVLTDGTDQESIVGGKMGKFNWKLDKRTGELAITGSGDMMDFSTAAPPPWDEYKAYINSITLQDTITKIGARAFVGCIRLRSITVPKGVTSIGSSAFSECSWLTTVTIPNSVTSIGEFAFCDCESLTSVTIPDSVTLIGDSAFRECSGLTSINIPNSVTSIGDYAFCSCFSLTKVTIGRRVTSVGYYAFYGCSSLEKVFVYSKNCYFDSECGLNYNQTIYGFAGSTAETFADSVFAEFVAMTEVLEITSQPKSASAFEDETVSVKVTATGDGRTYTWYYKNAGASDYKKSSVTKATYSVTMDADVDGRTVYCVVKDKYGNSVKTNTVKLSMKHVAKITTQPKNATAPKGSTAKVTVAATGDGLTYTWYYKNAGASSFSKSSIKKANYSTTMDASVNGRQVYCVVKDQYGKSVKSNTVKLYMGNPAKITTQPKNANVTKGSAAKVTVAATGDGLTYTWYYKNAGASAFSKSSVAKATYGATMDAKVNGRQVYCVVKDKYGNTVKSNTVTLTMKQVAKITTQPKNVTVAKGSAAKVTVAATGDGLTYTWYYKNAGASAFSKSSVAKATYGATMDAKVNGRQVYCVVKDKYGNSVKSTTVTLTMKQTAKITTQPTSVTVANGKAAKVTVVASGDGLTYTWYYKNAGASSFSKSSVAKATYGATMDAKVNGRQVYCVVADKYGNTVKSSTVTLKMK